MIWKLGQMVMCDRAEGAIVGCIVQIEFNSLVISCSASQTVICGQQRHLQQLGWRLTSGETAYGWHHSQPDGSQPCVSD